MATITLKRSAQSRQYGNIAPYGNVSVLAFAMATIANGSVVSADSTAAVGIGDVIDLGPLPEGMRLDGGTTLVNVGMTATITGKLGFKYEDGVDDANVPQDDAYFGTGITIATAGRYGSTNTKLLTLPKPARLILTTAVAVNAKISDLKFLISGEMTGNK